MQRAVAGIGVTVVFKLMVSLCLALYCSMAIWGDGPPRMTDRALRLEGAAAPAPAASGIRVLPAPPRPVRIGPQLATATKRGAKGVPDGFAAVVASGLPAARVVDTLPANVARRWVTANSNVRSGPNKRSALAGKIGTGGEVWVLWAEPNGWVKLRSAKGDVTGFVHKSLLTDKAPKATLIAVAD